MKRTLIIIAVLAASPAIAQPQTKAESAGCFISETNYYRQRLLNELGLEQLNQNHPLYLNMLNAIAEAVNQKCSVTK